MLLLEEDRPIGPLKLLHTIAWDGSPLYFTQRNSDTVQKRALVVFTTVLHQTRWEQHPLNNINGLRILTWLPRKLKRTMHSCEWVRDALSFVYGIEKQLNIPISNMVFAAEDESNLIVQALLQDYCLQPKALINLNNNPSEKIKNHSVIKINNQHKVPLMIKDDDINILNGLKHMGLRLQHCGNSPRVSYKLNGVFPHAGYSAENFIDECYRPSLNPATTTRTSTSYCQRPIFNFLNRRLKQAKKLGLFSKEFTTQIGKLKLRLDSKDKQDRLLNSFFAHASHQKLIFAHLINHCLMENDGASILDLSISDSHDPIGIISRYESNKIRTNIVKADERELLSQQIYCMQQGLHQIQFSRANIFEPMEIKTLEDSVDLVCAFGLTENILQQQQLLRLLQSIRCKLKPNAYLLISNHPHHPVTEKLMPQICSSDGGVFRSQIELLSILNWAGFQSEKIYLDHDSMFSVIVARNLLKRGTTNA